MRLDVTLVERKIVSSRTRAANLIALGKVFVNGQAALKSALDVSAADTIELKGDYPASLGGIKLLLAFEQWPLDVLGKVCLDVGASNGGFTQVLLDKGASAVYALDVAECAICGEILSCGKVIPVKANARYITKSDFDKAIDFICVDVSFISLKLILPTLFDIIESGGIIVALIKPQFESKKSDLTKNGILKDPLKRAKIVKEIESFALNLGALSTQTIAAPHPFEEKNQEYLILIQK